MNNSPLLTALFHPLNIAMLLLTIGAGLLSAWWMAPVGLLFWFIMVLSIARDPGLHLTYTRQNRQPLSQRYQVRFDRLERARISIYNALGQGPSSHILRTIEPVQAALDDLVEYTYSICLRMSALDNHFTVQSLTSDFKSEIDKLEDKIEKTDNVVIQQEYQDTIHAMQERQQQLKSLSSILDRFEAQLTGTTNAVNGIVTEAINLKGRNQQQAKEKIEPLTSIIQTEKKEMQQFDEEIESFSIINNHN